MEKLKQIGAGFLDQMGAGRNKPPPDDLMVSCKKQLVDLRDEIQVVKQQFSQYAHQVVEAAEASVTLSKSVGRFYSKANHPGRTESVNTYKKVQEDIANRAVNTFHITVENGLLSELAEWIQLVDNLKEKIINAESTRITAHDTQNRLLSLQNEYQDKKTKKQGLFGGNREQDLEDLQQRISEATDAQKSLSVEYQKSRNSIAQQVKQLMEKRYRYFDRVYVQMLECQLEYFQHCNTQSKRFQRDIDYYRKQYPKTNEFRNSNGNIGDLPKYNNGVPSSATSSKLKKTKSVEVNSTSTASAAAAMTTNGATTNNHRRSSIKKVPQTRPPPPNYTNTTTSTASTTNTTTDTMNSTVSSTQSTSQASSPVINGNHPKHVQIHPSAQQLQSEKAQSSPPQNSTSSHYKRQQSTHDILNLNGPMSPQQTKPNPKITKQDSLFGGLLNHTDPVPDDHGLYDLGNPQENDFMGLGGFDSHANAKKGGKNPKGQYSQSTSALKQQKSYESNTAASGGDDLFGDFFGGGATSNPSSPQKATAHHAPQDSFLGGLLENKPASNSSANGHQSQSLEQQMGAAFNAPSYGGGHGQNQSNGHGHRKKSGGGSKAKSPSITASSTASAPSNGANSELSEADKVRMVNMKLTDKQKKNAEAAYNAAMAEREQKEQEIMQAAQQKEYFKDKHEAKLKQWEFDNTVRRNIRTLIGKLPDVLPPSVKWTPIPMTKLLNDAQLKKGYFKAVRAVHPDKSQQRGDDIETQVICDYVFQALEQAFNTKFG